MPVWQWTQLLLGLTIPFLLVKHALFTAGAMMLFDVKPNYSYVLAFYWHFAPGKAWLHATLLIVVWSHGCIGLHHWLKFKSWYAGAKPYLYALAVMIPLASLLGFISAGIEVKELAKNQQWLLNMAKEIQYPGRAVEIFVDRGVDLWWTGLGATIAFVFLSRVVRYLLQRRKSCLVTYYPQEQTIRLSPGSSVLDGSRSAGIPHSSVCGGRARCATCRVRVLHGLQNLHAPNPTEAKVLERLKAPPAMRLACQIRPTADISIEPLIPPSKAETYDLEKEETAYRYGKELEIAIMFADLRGFTQLSEKRLPFDVVYLLNSYFASMGKAIVDSGGKIDKFIGDGIMALFGIDGDAKTGCRNALRAARLMGEQLELLNRALGSELSEPLRMVIGIHVGPSIVGEMGYGEAMSVTAIGDAVNTASRLESLAKERNVQIVFSEVTAELANFDATNFPHEDVMIRGRMEPLSVVCIQESRELPVL